MNAYDYDIYSNRNPWVYYICYVNIIFLDNYSGKYLAYAM